MKNGKRSRYPRNGKTEGYDDYDGYAWYRVKFKLPQNFSTGEYYLSLGKIDDIDDVYLNGKYIGSVYDLKKDGDYKRTGWEYNARRIYKIPEDLLNRDGMNIIAIRVYDGQLGGGIYEGPVGIMSAENYKRYRNKYYTNQSFWDYWYDKFNELIITGRISYDYNIQYNQNEGTVLFQSQLLCLSCRRRFVQIRTICHFCKA